MNTTEFMKVITNAHGTTIKNNKVKAILNSRKKINKENKNITQLAHYFNQSTGKSNRVVITDFIDKANPDEIVHIFSLEIDCRNDTIVGLESIMEAFNNEVIVPFQHFCTHMTALSNEEIAHTITYQKDLEDTPEQLGEELEIASENLFRVLDNLFIKSNNLKALIIEDKQIVLPIESFTSEAIVLKDEQLEKKKAKIDETSFRKNRAIAYCSEGFDQTFTFPPREKKTVLRIQETMEYFDLEFDWSQGNHYPVLTSFPKVLKQIELLEKDQS